MAETKKKLMRYSGKTLARLIKYVARTSRASFEPADLKDRLKATHPCIVACWHGQFMMICELHPGGDVKVSAMVARHGDAEVIGEAMRLMDVELIRGAGAGGRKKDRGGAAALRAAVKGLTDGSSLVMTADVPPGPARKAGAGIITIARMSGCPIVPVAAASSRFMSFDTWSRMTLNLPHSNLVFAGDEPIHVPRDADPELLESLRLKLETSLNTLTARAYSLAGADLKRATPLGHLAALSPPEPGLGLKTYRSALSVLRPLAPALLSARERMGKEDAARRGERLGFPGLTRPDGPLAWVHAASVGETNAVLPVIDALLTSNPGAHVLLTTGTTTSAGLAARRLPERAFHQFVPLDAAAYAARFLDHWRPDVAVFTESEIWPNLILETSKRKIPLALINARMSPRSMKRWRRNARVARPLFSRFNIILLQNDRISRTVTELGAPVVITAGNLKIDSPPPPVDPAALATLRETIGTRPVFLAASTHPGEDGIIAAAHSIITKTVPNLLTIIVPRHPDRGPALIAEMTRFGHKTERRSQLPAPAADTDVYIADTIGELGTFYALAPVSLIGGSLIEHGGQNPIEAIRHGSAVLTGPSQHNFRDIYEALSKAGGAVTVSSAEEIATHVTRLFTEKADADKQRQRADAALVELGGALEKTLAALQPYLSKQRT